MKLISPASALLAVIGLQAATADYTVKVAPKTKLVTWEGWGTSLAWWANVFGKRADIADVLFTTKASVDLPSVKGLPGLGFNIARYNVGGSGSNTVVDGDKDKLTMKKSEKMPAFKDIESFWLDWFSKDPTSKSWNWEADATQRAMLTLAKQRGANIFEAFSNSPPWWMTVNNAVAGGAKGQVDNLQSWNQEDFALYMATVVKHAKDNWGITFDYVEPFNEPMAGWWTFPGTQEGCSFTLNTQKNVLIYLRKHLDSRGLKSVGIAASDENKADQALDTLKTLSGNQSVIATVNKVNTHGYEGLKPYRGKARGPLRDLTQKLKKNLWDSEYGEDDASGLSLGESIALDINEMGVSAFVYWQALDGGAWGLLQSNPGDNWIGTPNPKYYVLAQYSRHIRQGMSIISSDDTKTVVAYDATRKLLVLVTVNTSKNAQSVSFDLSGFTAVGTSASVWTTETSEKGARYVSSKATVSGKTVKAASPAASVVTVEISGVTL